MFPTPTRRSQRVRHANAIPLMALQTLQDTIMLGCHILKGTDVFLVANGYGYLEPDMDVSDTVRGLGRVAAEARFSRVFETIKIAARSDPRAGSRQTQPRALLRSILCSGFAFGLGPCGCYNKRLALYMLKMQFILIALYLTPLPNFIWP
ncbi:hypothetical protein F4678DRAFT_427871 [Xylaria arbuscula]|nr:hypothetical protein F4678DRAFT_427871 [Xylaria arbuscula]